MSEAPASPVYENRLPQEVIRRKRDGTELDAVEIAAFIEDFTAGDVTGEQAAAFAMAVFFRGMSRPECAALTRAMTHSGQVLDWATHRLSGPVLDKHSTGGVGDNVSLILAPALAACGAYVPMISGRGLGHSGGTLDKLEAIPGYRTALGLADLQRIVAKIGCAIVGATADLAPADGRLYAIRDVTATVESIPLITASILSKKCAAGLDGLVMDVKTGSGAFMSSLADARALAKSLVETAAGAGLRTTALITDMDQSLASAAGNGLEVRHAIDHLTGAKREARVHAVVLALGGALLCLGGLDAEEAGGQRRIEDAIASGAAAERFASMATELGGPSDLIERPDRHLLRAPVIRDVVAPAPGFVFEVDARRLGLAVVGLGGGRTRPGAAIDHRVGFTGLAAIGTELDGRSTPIGTVHARHEAEAEAAAAMLRSAYRIEGSAPPARPPVLERL